MKNISVTIRSFIPSALKLTVAAFLLGAIWAGVGPADVQAEIRTSFLYRLSNFSGPVPSNWATISFDEERDEIYVTDRQAGIVRIYNDRGMEIYRFGDDWSLGMARAAAVRNDGNILVLTRRDSKTSIVICNFRGESMVDLDLQAFPP